MSDGTTGTLQFEQHHLPGLLAGEYRLDLAQTIAVKEAKADSDPVARTITAAASSYFAVAGNRFRPLGDDLVQLFPADTARGEYGRSFPHVVLANDTLPWSRSPTTRPIAPKQTVPGIDNNVPSFLAVLLLTEDDGVPMAPVIRTVADLFPDAAATTRHSYFDAGGGLTPADQLDIGESLSDPCLTLDLPLGVFAQIAPTLADLAVLAHVRLTARSGQTAGNLAADAGNGDRQSYAVLMGSRMLPAEPEKQCRAVLVSLEGLSHLLPQDDEGTLPDGLAATDMVRLACLVSWGFVSTGTGRHFELMLSGLDGRAPDGRTAEPDQLLRMPAPTTAAGSDAARLAAQALRMGYVPLPHQTRDGGHTVSWYRGPLTPYAVGRFVPDVFGSADAATGYDPDTALFDASYAAGWQIGRLMAMGSKAFSVALHVWRRGQLRGSVGGMHRVTLAQAAARVSDGVRSAAALQGIDVLGRFLVDSAGAAGVGPAWPATAAAARALLGDQPPLAVPDAIATWLGGLILLCGVPFHYLVPHEAMLPPESIRFFTVDPNWVSALIDGACSVGRAGGMELRQDAAARQALLTAAVQAAFQLRATALGLTAPQPTTGLPALSGFLLRSAAVGFWPNLQINGYGPPAEPGDDGPPLPLLRFERLADSEVVIGLFAAPQLVCLDLHEPPEGLHFGLDDAQDVIFQRATSPDQGAIGSVMHDAQGQAIPHPVGMRKQTVVKADALARALGKPGPVLASSDFGMQMLKGAARVRYVADLSA
jgi:hypothetical protein